MEGESPETISALQENIKRKGNNAYYYAHSLKVDGPTWDGKEEPRLLSVSTTAHSSDSSTEALGKQKKKEAISDYSWLDSNNSVKIYIEFSRAGDIPDDDIILVTDICSIISYL